ncbi:unnamed protein product [Peniophora sp. CBMAI 1063]|nr:unnamed protein product [Peniophora sp. CBMAI 1063]
MANRQFCSPKLAALFTLSNLSLLNAAFATNLHHGRNPHWGRRAVNAYSTSISLASASTAPSQPSTDANATSISSSTVTTASDVARTSIPTSFTSTTASTLSSTATPTTLPNATTSSIFDTILNRRIDFLLRDVSGVANVQTWLDTLTANGTWPDVDYTSGCDAQKANWPAQEHWERIVTLTAAWHGGLPSSDQWVADQDLASGFLSAMDWWFANDFNNTDCLDFGGNVKKGDCACGTPGLWNQNWYSNAILIPTYVGEACVLANSTLTSSQLSKCEEILSRGYGEFFNTVSPGHSSGSNGLLLAAIGVDLGLLTGNTTTMAEAFNHVDIQLVPVPDIKADGIKPDGSFGQHLGLLYNGNYGKDFANDVMALEIEAGGSEFAANDTGMQAFESFWDANQWMIVYNTATGVLHWDLSCVGRMISFPTDDNQATAGLKINLTEVLTLGELWNSQALQDVYNGLEKEVSSANAGGLQGLRVFQSNDYVVQRGKNYVTTLKMYSDRTLNTECTNAQNPYGFHLSDFTIYTYINGDEYEDIAGAWDWNLIPGSTVDYGNTPLNCDDAKVTGTESMVGAVTNGKIGAAAMRYTNPLTLDLSWKKAMFFLSDDTQVVMVSNISSQSNASVLSVLDQRRYSGEIHVDGNMIDVGVQNFSAVSTLWHGHTGYVFDNDMNATLTVSAGERDANWTNIGISTVQGTVDLFTAYLEHGNLSRSLQYIAYPGTDLKTFLFKSVTRSILTIANDDQVAAVFDVDHAVFAAVFWDATGGSVSYADQTVSASGNVALVVDLRAWTLTVSDPTQSLSSVNIVLDSKQYHVTLPTDPLTVGTSVIQRL